MSYFSIDELCRSDTAEKYGIENVPSEEELHNLLRLIREVLDPARSILNKPITISSGFIENAPCRVKHFSDKS